MGGDLRPERLLAAYSRGIFPWYDETQPILWWSPDPRAVLFTDALHVSRSLRRASRRLQLSITVDRAFEQVIAACAEPRGPGEGTWITPEMRRAYCRLHRLGDAHSVECWQDGNLVGGLYGVAIGRVFFGESMFSRISQASKLALVELVAGLRLWGFPLVDCQQDTEHLRSLGARTIARAEFLDIVTVETRKPGIVGSWSERWPTRRSGADPS